MRDEITDPGSDPEKVRDDPDSPWQKRLENQFKLWREQILADQTPLDPPEEPVPDLYSFFAQLCALRTEMRRSAKRSHETFAGFAETLSQFDSVLADMTQRQEDSTLLEENGTDTGHRSFILAVVDLFERFKRICDKMDEPPKPGFFFQSRKWESTWRSLKEGFWIVRDHFENLLRQQGVMPMETLGRPFDPNLMKAVAFERTETTAPNMVIEELTGGYRYRDRVLKYAEVKVTIAIGSS